MSGEKIVCRTVHPEDMEDALREIGIMSKDESVVDIRTEGFFFSKADPRRFVVGIKSDKWNP